MASKAMPSLIALLGLAAVAGYQNRDKLRDMISDSQRGGPVPADGDPDAGRPGGGLFGEIGKMFGSEDSGTNLREGLGSLVDRFRSAGHGDKADSWVSNGDNAEVQEDELESVLGADTLDELEQKTGLSRAELVQRLKSALPDTVHKLTPSGQVPSDTEAKELL